MSERQYKKLCKKSAEIIGMDKCDLESGIYSVFYPCSMDEYDSCPAWDSLVDRFHDDVNIIADENSECGISWKQKDELIKPTPANVFAWARKQEWK